VTAQTIFNLYSLTAMFALAPTRGADFAADLSDVTRGTGAPTEYPELLLGNTVAREL
jgi:hypothetical protein